MRIHRFALVAAAAVALLVPTSASASTPGADVRLSNDAATAGGYTSDYTLVTGTPYSDPTLDRVLAVAWSAERAGRRDRSAQHAA